MMFDSVNGTYAFFLLSFFPSFCSDFTNSNSILYKISEIVSHIDSKLEIMFFSAPSVRTHSSTKQM